MQSSLDFGDQSPVATNVTTVQHIYQPGIYTATLTVSADSQQDKSSLLIVVSAPPVAKFSLNKSGTGLPITVTFSDQSTGTVSTYDWLINNVHYNTANPVVTFTVAGTFAISLTVSGPDGRSSVNGTIAIGTGSLLTASFTSSVVVGTAPLTTILSSTSSGAITDYIWQCDGSAAAEGASLAQITENFANPGSYNCILTVKDANGNSASVSGTILVKQAWLPVKAGFNVSTDVCVVPCTVIVTDTASGDVNTWNYSADGEINSQRNPTFTFSTPGDVLLTQTVSGPAGIDQLTHTIHVTAPVAPVKAQIDVISEAPANPLSVMLTSSRSTGSIASYAWTVVDPATGATLATGIDPTLSFTAAQEGTFLAMLTLNGTDNSTSSTSKVFSVVKVDLPTANFNLSPGSSGPAPFNVTISNTSISGSMPIVSCHYDLGDSTTSDNCQPFTHVYPVGDYNVTLTVTDSNGHQTAMTKLVHVYPPHIVAACSVSVSIVFVGVSVNFTDNSYGMPAVDRQWQLDDNPATTSTVQNPTYAYTTAGTKTVVLSVTDANGYMATCTRQIRVLSQGDVAAAISVSPSYGPSPLTVKFTDHSVGNIQTRTLSFGDGSPSATLTQGGSVTHIYSRKQTNSVSYTVVGLSGAQDTTTATVQDLVPLQVQITAQPSIGIFPMRTQLCAVTNDNSNANSFTWDMGDASGARYGKCVEYVYRSVGQFVASVSAQGPAGKATASQTISVTDGSSLQTNFVASVYAGLGSAAHPLSVCFTDESFGDLTQKYDFGGLGTSNARNPCFNFSQPGQYVVRLTTTGAGGVSGAATQIIQVFDSSLQEIHLQYQTTGNFGACFSVDVSGQSVMTFTYGDGTSGSSPCHQYPGAGVFNVVLYLKPANGSPLVGFLPITINADGSIVPIASPTAPAAGGNANPPASPSQSVTITPAPTQAAAPVLTVTVTAALTSISSASLITATEGAIAAATNTPAATAAATAATMPTEAPTAVATISATAIPASPPALLATAAVTSPVVTVTMATAAAENVIFPPFAPMPVSVAVENVGFCPRRIYTQTSPSNCMSAALCFLLSDSHDTESVPGGCTSSIQLAMEKAYVATTGGDFLDAAPIVLNAFNRPNAQVSYQRTWNELLGYYSQHKDMVLALNVDPGQPLHAVDLISISSNQIVYGDPLIGRTVTMSQADFLKNWSGTVLTVNSPAPCVTVTTVPATLAPTAVSGSVPTSVQPSNTAATAVPTTLAPTAVFGSAPTSVQPSNTTTPPPLQPLDPSTLLLLLGPAGLAAISAIRSQNKTTVVAGVTGGVIGGRDDSKGILATVRIGDWPTPYSSLSDIALRVYGNASLYPKIAEFNGIANANLVYPGQIVNVPILDSNNQIVGPKAPQPPPPTYNGQITSSIIGMWVLKQPGLYLGTGNRINAYPDGTLFNADSKCDKDGHLWVHITTSDGVTGWMASEWSKIDNLANLPWSPTCGTQQNSSGSNNGGTIYNPPPVSISLADCPAALAADAARASAQNDLTQAANALTAAQQSAQSVQQSLNNAQQDLNNIDTLSQQLTAAQQTADQASAVQVQASQKLRGLQAAWLLSKAAAAAAWLALQVIPAFWQWGRDQAQKFYDQKQQAANDLQTQINAQQTTVDQAAQTANSANAAVGALKAQLGNAALNRIVDQARILALKVMAAVTDAAVRTAQSTYNNDLQALNNAQALVNVRLADCQVKSAPSQPVTGDTPDRVQKAALNITAAWEGSGYASYQNIDAGIVSYGRYQFTLQSGSLDTVLSKYLATSNSATANALRAYQSRVQANAPELRNDTTFRDLLIAAANEPEMQAAQEQVAVSNYYDPAMTLSVDPRGLQTPLAKAFIFDTANQYGPYNDVLLRAEKALGVPFKSKIGSNGITEEQLIRKAAEIRQQDMIAYLSQNPGATGVTNRTNFWLTLINNGDWQLHGDANGNINANGNTVHVWDPPQNTTPPSSGNPGNNSQVQAAQDAYNAAVSARVKVQQELATLSATLSTLQNAAANAAQQLSQTIGIFINKIKDFVQGILNNAGILAGLIRDQLTAAMDNLTNQLQSLVTSAASTGQQIVSNIGNTIQDLLNKANPVISNIGGWLQARANDISSFFANLQNAFNAKQNAQQKVDKQNQVINQLQTKVTQLTQQEALAKAKLNPPQVQNQITFSNTNPLAQNDLWKFGTDDLNITVGRDGVKISGKSIAVTETKTIMVDQTTQVRKYPWYNPNGILGDVGSWLETVHTSVPQTVTAQYWIRPDVYFDVTGAQYSNPSKTDTHQMVTQAEVQQNTWEVTIPKDQWPGFGSNLLVYRGITQDIFPNATPSEFPVANFDVQIKPDSNSLLYNQEYINPAPGYQGNDNNGCGPTSLGMILDYFHFKYGTKSGFDLTPGAQTSVDALIQYANKNGAIWDQYDGLQWLAQQDGYNADFVGDYNVSGSTLYQTISDQLKNHPDSQILIPAYMEMDKSKGGHWFDIIGVDNSSGENIIVKDPWHGTVRSFSADQVAGNKQQGLWVVYPK